MLVHLSLAAVISCSVSVQDPGPTLRNEVLLTIGVDSSADLSMLKPTLHTSRSVFLDPRWPKVKLLASRNGCYPNWTWNAVASSTSPMVHVILSGEDAILDSPTFDPRMARLLDLASISAIVGEEVGETSAAPSKAPAETIDRPCSYRFEVDYSLDVWMPDLRPKETFKAYSEGFTIQCDSNGVQHESE
jgi:hypothetical protein